MNDSACYFFWFLSMLISATGALAWMKVVTRADPDWKAKNHRWYRYIIAGVGSIYVSFVFYYLGFFVTGGGFSSPYEAADDFWFFILINGPAAVSGCARRP